MVSLDKSSCIRNSETSPSEKNSAYYWLFLFYLTLRANNYTPMSEWNKSLCLLGAREPHPCGK